MKAKDQSAGLFVFWWELSLPGLQMPTFSLWPHIIKRECSGVLSSSSVGSRPVGLGSHSFDLAQSHFSHVLLLRPSGLYIACQAPFSMGFFFFFFFLVKRVIYLFIFSFIFISWRLITLQYCSAFCHTLTWISHGFTCVPHPDPPSRFPLYWIPLGLPSAPGPSICLMHMGFFRQEYWSGCHALV